MKILITPDVQNTLLDKDLDICGVGEIFILSTTAWQKSHP